MSRRSVRGWGFVVALAAGLWCASGVEAQSAPFTGYELALDGARTVRVGRQALFRGTAYRVRGLAELVPFDGRARARYWNGEGAPTAGPWRDLALDGDGRFTITMPIPAGFDPSAAAHLEIEVGPDGDARTFEVPLGVRPAVTTALRTDRVLYQSAEPVHAWALVRDAASRRPLASESVTFLVEGPALGRVERTVTTAASGVAHLELTIPDDAPEGAHTVRVRVRGQDETIAHFRVGTRTYERLFATLEIEPEPVAPGASAMVHVELTTPSGAVVRDARVVITVDSERTYEATTDERGEARVEVTAPAYLSHESGLIDVMAELTHPAHGSVRVHEPMHLAVPLALTVDAQPRHGVLVPEIDDVLYVRLHDALDRPPPAATEVTIEGPAIVGGRATAQTDANGIAEIRLRLPIGASSRQNGRSTTSVIAHIAGPLERTARLELPVSRDVDIAPTPARATIEPGSSLDVELTRRPRAARSPAVLELLDDRGEVRAVRWVAPGDARTTIDVPADLLGIAALRVRALRDAESWQSAGGFAAVLVRPARIERVRVEAVEPRYTVGEAAQVRIITGQSDVRQYGALVVRDLAAHGGEVPFTLRFLEERFDEALDAPNDAEGDRLVRAALAAVTRTEDAPVEAPPLTDGLGLASESGLSPSELGALRDPRPLAHELERRGIGPMMTALEERLTSALEAGALDEVTEVRGGRRRLRDDLLDDELEMRTLGAGAVTAAILEAADPSFTYDHVARRVARRRLVHLLAALAVYLDPGDGAPPAARAAANEPSSRWLARMVERGVIGRDALLDPWGGRFELRAAAHPAVVVSAHATGLELASPGPDGRFGNGDDVRDPFERAVPRGTPYAIACGEDALMRQLAVLSTSTETLALILQSYARLNVEMFEELIGDAVAAGVAEGTIGLGNLGTIGHGSGSGSGSGYGYGGLGLRGTGRGGGGTGEGTVGLAGLAAVIRERFPPTLRFDPSLEIDPGGTTEVSFELADAVTTYLVEAIVWREDGWVSSASTRIEVDREVVVDAPIPDVAHVGDTLQIPIRVANHGDEARELRVQLLGDDALGIDGTEPTTLRVSPGDAAVVPIRIAPRRVGEGRLTVVVSAPDGTALDAARRPIEVIRNARRVAVERTTFSRSRVAITLENPPRVDPRDGQISITAGSAIFDARDEGWPSWVSGTTNEERDPAREIQLSHSDPERLGFALGRAWSDASVDDGAVTVGVTWLARRLDMLNDRGAASGESDEAARVTAAALLGLAPAIQRPDARDVEGMGALISRLRERVATDALARSDDPARWIVAAAALGWTTPRGGDMGTVRELVRRAERSVVALDADRWLPTERGAVQPTLLYGMALASLRRGDAAFVPLATVARYVARGGRMSAQERGLAHALTRRLTRGRAVEQATVTIDGEDRTVDLPGGSATLSFPSLANGGAHRVEVRADGAPLLVRAGARYGIAWDAPPAEPGPLVLSLEGETGSRDETATLELVVRNRSARTLAQPIVEIELPTGAELTAAANESLGARTERGGGVLTLHLSAMRPGNERRIALPLRWSVAGTLRGLGVSAYARERPDAVSLLAPRSLSIEESVR
ncbi:MAG: MG2 domain-containing protein [Sandaracinaceae bacterium]